ncbi:MAG: hypothetical protein ACR2NV_02715 [Thermoleophilaceae bacterium]
MSEEQTRVRLPRRAEGPFEVWVNGVAQQEGEDYDVERDTLLFHRRLAEEGRLGFWRWTSIFLGLIGTYRQNDSVDVRYRSGGEQHLATGLDIQPAGSPESRDSA